MFVSLARCLLKHLSNYQDHEKSYLIHSAPAHFPNLICPKIQYDIFYGKWPAIYPDDERSEL